MKLFVAWTNREVPYHYAAARCRVLVSPNNVPRAWRCSSWTEWPEELIVDSGAYQRDGGLASPETIMARQRQMVADAPASCRIMVSHADRRLDLRSYAPGTWQEGFDDSLERALAL